MKIFLIFAILVSGLTGCDYLPTSENKAKKIVSEALIDPDSAKFRSISAGLHEGEFCGYVDGKNRMGGYAGATPFIVNTQTGSAEIGENPITKADFRKFALLLSTNADFMEIVKEEIELKKRCTFPERWKNACKDRYAVNVLERPVGLCFAITNGVQDGGYRIMSVMREAFP